MGYPLQAATTDPATASISNATIYFFTIELQRESYNILVHFALERYAAPFSPTPFLSLLKYTYSGIAIIIRASLLSTDPCTPSL